MTTALLAWNHRDNRIGTALSHWPGRHFERPALFYPVAAFGELAVASVATIPERAIGHPGAHRLKRDSDHGRNADSRKAEDCSIPLRNKPMLILALWIGFAGTLRPACGGTCDPQAEKAA